MRTDGLGRMAGVDPRGQRQPMLGRDALRVGLHLSIVGITLLLHVSVVMTTKLLRFLLPLARGVVGAISSPQRALLAAAGVTRRSGRYSRQRALLAAAGVTRRSGRYSPQRALLAASC